MKMMLEYSKEKGFNEKLAFKLRRIIRKENSFLFGMAEVITHNFDLVFRYLYAGAIILLMAGQFIY